MLKTTLTEILRNGENSGVEFKRDDVHPDSLATEIAALANLEGGEILLGVEDDGRPSGLTRTPKEAEEWVVNVCRNNVRPPLLPYWETIASDDGTVIGVLSIPADAPDKPYKAKRGSAWVAFIRVGSTSREATREEEGRLYQSSGLFRYELRPVLGAGLGDLDRRRLKQYFADVSRRNDPPPDEDDEGWLRLLVNTELMVEDRGRAIPTVAGMLLFGASPNRFLPQAGIRAVAYPSHDKDYATIDDAQLRGPCAPLRANGGLVELGLVDQALDFVRRNTSVSATLEEGARRVERRDYPEGAVREAVVNAVVHRDYSIATMDIALSIYDDRLEILSPGRLTNGMTVERMKTGLRATRNEVLKETLRDYLYVDARGLGVPFKIVDGMRKHNGTDPDLVEDDTTFLVRLRK